MTAEEKFDTIEWATITERENKQLKARIKELEDNEQVLNDAHCKLMDKLEKAEAHIKELEDENAALKKSALDYCSLNDKYEAKIKELEEQLKKEQVINEYKDIEMIVHEYIKKNLKVITERRESDYLGIKIYLENDLITEDDAYVG